MNIAFRVDASLDIGIGHVMRCLTLANALSELEGIYVRFFCRQLPLNLSQLLLKSGHDVVRLNGVEESPIKSSLMHGEWLTVNQVFDAEEVLSAMIGESFDWLIIDHYAIDQKWHDYAKAKLPNIKLMVIDDLADRMHNCDLLLDQTFSREPTTYKGLVPSNCYILTGSEYAMLRPGFSDFRAYSIERRKSGDLKNILITMGGTDNLNATSVVLEVLNDLNFLKDTKLTIVLGGGSIHVSSLSELAKKSHFITEIKVNVCNMEQLMANSDLVIGAAGSTSWERCCLGVPSVMVVLADNQILIATALDKAGAAINIGNPWSSSFKQNFEKCVRDIFFNPTFLKDMSNKAAEVTSGDGVFHVAKLLCELTNENNDSL